MPRQTGKPDASLPDLTDAEILQREAANGLRQFDLMLKMAQDAIAGLRPAAITPADIQALHAVAVEGLEVTGGQWRTCPIVITGSSHRPPAAEDVPQLVVDLCQMVNVALEKKADALRPAALVMWRLNWIHPFTNGNGRTTRALSYYLLCVCLGMVIPGSPTIAEQIAADRTPYYAALDEADAAWSKGILNLKPMRNLLVQCLRKQLGS